MMFAERQHDSDKSVRAPWLLALPFVTYALSYFYLAVYHRKLWLWNTVVHESGQLTLGETMFYASHFLGHLPSLTIVAVLFCGSVELLLGHRFEGRVGWRKYAVGWVVLLGISLWISGVEFGWEQTREYLLQQRQGAARLEEGGSWLLHLPTTTLLFAGLPVYVAVAAWFHKVELSLNRSAVGWFAGALVAVVYMTYIVTSHFGDSVRLAWSDARYLAHSVREMATYPVTFFPIPLYVVLRSVRHSRGVRTSRQGFRGFIVILGIIAAGGLAWQVWAALSVGVHALAQHPPFAKGGALGIPYLLAAHYFEHVLDTFYFTWCSLLLLSWRSRRDS